MERLTIYIKPVFGKQEWKQCLETTKKEHIYEDLVNDFMNREHGYSCRLKDVNNYDGTRTLTFYMDGVKKVYIIKD